MGGRIAAEVASTLDSRGHALGGRLSHKVEMGLGLPSSEGSIGGPRSGYCVGVETSSEATKDSSRASKCFWWLRT